MSEIHLELLLSRPVRAMDGQTIGRVEEIVVERSGDHGDYLMDACLVGFAGLLTRLGSTLFPFVRRGRHGYRIRWDQIDLSDPDNLRLTCPVEELEAIRN